MIDRRKFIQVLGTAAGTGLISACQQEKTNEEYPVPGRLDRIGLALYSIPHMLNEDFEGTLRMIAETGYREVEFAGPYFFSPQSVRENSILIQMFNLTNYGYYGNGPSDLRSLLDELGLEAVSAHVSLETMLANLEGVLEAAQVVGHRYIVCPMLMAGTLDEYREGIDHFNRIGARFRESGIQFLYHNHHHEFGTLDGQVPLDVIVNETDPEHVGIELDLFWTTLAGVDPADVIDRHKGRIKILHVKDMASPIVETPDVNTFSNPEAIENIFANLADVGHGVIDFPTIFTHAEKAGVEHYFVERDFPEDQPGFIERSYAYLSEVEF